MKNKIGEIITIKEDFEIKTMIEEKPIQIKKGDQGFVDSNGSLHYISGRGRGKQHIIADCEVQGYDHSSIANLVYLRLLNRFGLSEIFDDYDIDSEDFICEIEDILREIL